LTELSSFLAVIINGRRSAKFGRPNSGRIHSPAPRQAAGDSVGRAVPSLATSADSRRLVRAQNNQGASNFRRRGCEFALHFISQIKSHPSTMSHCGLYRFEPADNTDANSFLLVVFLIFPQHQLISLPFLFINLRWSLRLILMLILIYGSPCAENKGHKMDQVDDTVRSGHDDTRPRT
jgi:hypothetical protein